MPKKKPIATIAPDVVIPEREREVVYTIVVPNCNDSVAIGAARRELHAHGVPSHLIDVDGTNVVVRRLFTLWQGDDKEQAWQRAVQAALPGALIDVADWNYAPGFPKGSIGTVEGSNGQ